MNAWLAAMTVSGAAEKCTVGMLWLSVRTTAAILLCM